MRRRSTLSLLGHDETGSALVEGAILLPLLIVLFIGIFEFSWFFYQQHLISLGVRDAKYAPFDIRKVLERLLLKGNIVVRKAYCDWDRYKEFKAPMHEAAFELIEIPHVRQSGKNSADIRMVVDALDEGVQRFYEQYGFKSLDHHDGRTRLFISMKTVAQLFA